LFFSSEAGGEHAAFLYTALKTAKLNGIDPEAYLAKAPPLRDYMSRIHIFAEIKIDRCHFTDICVL